MTRATLAGILAAPLLVLAACAGVGYEAEADGKYAPSPEQRVAEAVVLCRKAGFPVVRLEVDGPRTLIRCASLEVTVMVKGAR